jgi:hypothetical protein
VGFTVLTLLEQAPAEVNPAALLGQLIVGLILSVTVTVNEQLAELPKSSVAVYVTKVLPIGKLDPLARPAVIATTGQSNSMI